MVALRKVGVVIKVLGCPEGVREHAVSVGSYSELDTWLLTNVDETGRFEVYVAGSTEQLTPSEFEQLQSTPSGSVILHVRNQLGFHQPVRSSLCPAAPRGLYVQQADNQSPVVCWKRADNGGTVAHYEVSVIDESFGPQRLDHIIERQQVAVPSVEDKDPRFFMHHLHPDSVHRVEVIAVSESGTSSGKTLARFYPQRRVEPGSEEAAADLQTVGSLLEPLCREFSAKFLRDPIFLLIGKQHHGKSSLVNHLIRCLTQRMNTPDQVEAAPPTKMETTLRSRPTPVPFGSHGLTFCDMPAFSTMSPNRKRDLNNLLWCVGDNWARGEESWWPASRPPDAVVIVVSLVSLREESDSLSDYLKELQAALKHELSTSKRTVFPFVVAATHKDKFLEEEGNAGRDPMAALERAESALKSMANTEYVFSLSNYKTSSWWVPAVTGSTYDMLCQLVTLAQNRTRSAHEGAVSPQVLGYVAFLIAVLVLLLAGIIRGVAGG